MSTSTYNPFLLWKIDVLEGLLRRCDEVPRLRGLVHEAKELLERLDYVSSAIRGDMWKEDQRVIDELTALIEAAAPFPRPAKVLIADIVLMFVTMHFLHLAGIRMQREFTQDEKDASEDLWSLVRRLSVVAP